jgi:DNA-binding NarL/FixJ family response regulator
VRLEARISLNRKRILIADAHPTMMAGIRLLLKDNFDVSAMVADDRSLSDVVGSSHFDLVIADLSIPVSSGGNIARLLKRLNPELRFIVLSVHDEPAVVNECLAAGAKGFVLKRAVVNDLLPALGAVLRGDTYVSPSIQIEHKKPKRQATMGEEGSERKEVR